MPTDADRGRFVWYDLMTSDPDTGTDFYTKLMGWATTPMEGSDMPYTMWTNNDKPFGGLIAQCFNPQGAMFALHSSTK